jgi:phosphatidylethanolamine-binding protein (PEBP) family uncharacterized protein
MFTLTIKAFVNGGDIPARFTCEGDDVSPSLDRKTLQQPIESHKLGAAEYMGRFQRN